MPATQQPLQIVVPAPVVYVDKASSPINFEGVAVRDAAVQVGGASADDIYSHNSYDENDIVETPASQVNWSTIEEINRNGISKRKESF